MEDERTEVVAAAHDLGIVPSSLKPPRPRAGAVRRAGLVDRLLTSAARCVTVQAPAGYGKTTVVQQWTELDERRWAWLTVDIGDSDSVVLIRHVAAALGEIVPLVRTRRLAAGRRPEPTQVLEAMAAELTAADRPFLLVLDDVHALTGAESPQVLDRLLVLVPEGSAVVLVGRHIPPVHQTRRRLRGDLAQLGPEDLLLDPVEATKLLRLAAPDASDAGVDALVERCEGWVAGLALASFALAEGSEGEALAIGLAGGPVLEYLREEYLDRLDASDRDLLVGSSILDVINGELCDEVLNRRDSGADLERLASAGNVLVTGLQDGGRWYRCHELYRDGLVHELRAASPRHEAELRRRAARWLLSHGYADAAMSQALAAGDLDLAAGAAYALHFTCVHNGRTASMERWLRAFPVAALRQDPRLLIAAAWTDFVLRRPEDFEHRIDLMTAMDSQHRLPDGSTLGLTRQALVMISGLGGVKETIDAAAEIVDAGPDASPWWIAARVVGSVAQWITGGLADPGAAFSRVEFDTRGYPAPNAVALAQLSLIHFWDNDDDTARGFLRQALRLVESAALEQYLPIAPVYAVLALDAAKRCSAGESREAANRVHQLMGEPWGLITRSQIELRLVLAEAALLLNDHLAAREQMRIVSSVLEIEPQDVRLHDRYEELRARLHAYGAGEVLTRAELRVLEQLRTHRSLEEIGRFLYVSRNTVKSHTIAIYRKLGVSSRSAAIEEAEAAGLLQG